MEPALKDAEAKPLTKEELERVIRELYFEKVQRVVKQDGKVKFEGKWYHVNGNLYKEPPSLKHGPGLAIDFENSLRRSRIETPRYEFKQGLLELSESPKLNEDLLKRIVNTVCRIANLGPRSEGFIYIGVADKMEDAERIKKIYGTEYIIISDHYVVGIDREAKKLGF